MCANYFAAAVRVLRSVVVFIAVRYKIYRSVAVSLYRRITNNRSGKPYYLPSRRRNNSIIIIIILALRRKYVHIIYNVIVFRARISFDVRPCWYDGRVCV